MTNEEKAREIGQTILIEDGIWHYASAEIAAITMAEWKDEEYKKDFNVPNYYKSFEEITNYIHNDVFAKGYNRARDFCIESFKEYLKNKKSQNGFNQLNTVCDVDTIDMIIDELIENFEL